MKFDNHAKEQFVEKKPKNIKFHLSLNDEQKVAKTTILQNKINVIEGRAGSGKTLLCCQIALDEMFNRNVDKIIIARPTVSREENGFLPGDIKEKMDPWLQPIYHNLFALYNKEKVLKDIQDGKIEIVPLQFMRGRTFVNSFIIIDEAQNIDKRQIEMVVGRLGKGSRMCICGDVRQIDLKKENESGLWLLKKISNKVDGLAPILLKENHRDPIVDSILNEIEKIS